MEKTRKFRKRPRTESSSDEEVRHQDVKADGIANELDLLRELREEQKARLKKKGLVAAKAVTSRTVVQDNSEEEDLKDPSRTRVAILLDGQFTGQTDRGANADPHEKLMNSYIDKKLAEKKLVASNTEQPSDKTSAEADLYEFGIDGGKRDGAEEPLSGGPMAWNTGIAEVELPVEFKLRNIEETALAQKKLSEEPHRRSKPVPGNLTANYNLHRREMAQAIRQKEAQHEPKSADVKDARTAERAENRSEGRHRGSGMASDNLAVQRFKKMENRKLR